VPEPQFVAIRLYGNLFATDGEPEIGWIPEGKLSIA
jgi:hypothetical protein